MPARITQLKRKNVTNVFWQHTASKMKSWLPVDNIGSDTPK